jgi:hypothetical protein
MLSLAAEESFFTFTTVLYCTQENDIEYANKAKLTIWGFIDLNLQFDINKN